MIERLIHHAEAAHPQQPHDFELGKPRAHGQRIDVIDSGGRAGTWDFRHGQSGAQTHGQNIQ
ncbi:hypothetical protein SDC9_164756 [bioreactor metagenome]|uniref:Uncharacterized protein n=1 Tax=bioreactor metagenome TaxID=1076179 RepID=A0A645FZQ6_9ZZZZ